MVELFFDLVFVFAVTQLSHGLLADLTATGALQTLVLFLALWWLWIYTSWVANWLDPERMPVRIMLFALMLGSLTLSSSLPHAFADKGLVFGCVFAAMQVGRTLFTMLAMRGHRPGNYRNFQRVACWLSLSGVFWIAGGVAAGDMRLALWIVAVAIEYVGPSVYFWVPGLGVSTTADWDIDGEHLAERCALFVIIALGESILVTGATFSELAWDRVHIGGFVVAFLGSAAMWWIYFDTGAVRARRRIVGSTDPGRQGRSVYTYIHLVIVAGIIVCAVADEIVLTHPEHADTPGVVAILFGPALYLVGNAVFKWVTNDRRGPPLSHLAGLALLLVLVPLGFAHTLTALALGAATTAVLIIVASWESMALRKPLPGEPARASR
ncbi:MAG: low temperature requirement protein A [Steroidobacteraceae bacterium]